MTLLCDTSLVSELARPQPNPGALAWSANVSSIKLSVVTLEEIFYGLASKPNTRIQAWSQTFLDTYCQVFPVTADIAKLAGELRGQLRSQGKPRSQADMSLAATARIHQLTLVTRNTRDFEKCSTTLLDSFT